jgi:hydroxymethylglutaryl-CoA lyase
MAADDLTGNMPTEIMLDWFDSKEIFTGVDRINFNNSLSKAITVFP